MSQVLKILSLISLFCLSSFAHAGSFHNNPSMSAQAVNSGSNIQFVATNVAATKTVFYQGGKFVKGQGKTWIERHNKNGKFKFREVKRDKTSIYLRDDSRGVDIRLNLQAKKVFYSDDDGNSFLLYNVTRTGGSAPTNNVAPTKKTNAASATTIEYSCNEGIPLILFIENVGSESALFWIHDGFKGSNLKRISSGAVSVYADRRNTVRVGRNRAVVNLDGIRDVCRKVKETKHVKP